MRVSVRVKKNVREKRKREEAKLLAGKFFMGGIKGKRKNPHPKPLIDCSS